MPETFRRMCPNYMITDALSGEKQRSLELSKLGDTRLNEVKLKFLSSETSHSFYVLRCIVSLQGKGVYVEFTVFQNCLIVELFLFSWSISWA